MKGRFFESLIAQAEEALFRLAMTKQKRIFKKMVINRKGKHHARGIRKHAFIEGGKAKDLSSKRAKTPLGIAFFV
jgi:hypothetical protein